MSRSWAALLTGAAVLAGVGAAAGLVPAQAVGRQAPALARPVGATLVCPAADRLPGGAGAAAGNAAAVNAAAGNAAVGIATGAAAAGSVTARVPGGRALAPRLPAALVGRAAGRGLVVRAHGPVAAGLAAEEVDTASNGALSAVACTPPVQRQWFVGAGTGPGERPQLLLANPSGSPALVSVTVLTPRGPTTTPTAQGIPVAPHATVRVPIARIAPGAAATAVEVTTLRGSVAAALHDVRANGRVPLGGDWVPGAAGPATTVTVAGVPGLVAGGRPVRRLVVANPGAVPVTEQVRLVTNAGSYVPAGLAAVTVAPGSARTVPLTRLVGESAAAVQVSGGAVLAGMVVATPGTAASDVAFLAASEPLTGPAVVPIAGEGAAAGGLLVLSATDGPASVEVVGRGGSHPVRVGADRSRELRLGAIGDGSGPVLVRPVAGSVWGSVVLDGPAPALAALPLVGRPLTVPVPAVAPATPN